MMNYFFFSFGPSTELSATDGPCKWWAKKKNGSSTSSSVWYWKSRQCNRKSYRNGKCL